MDGNTPAHAVADSLFEQLSSLRLQLKKSYPNASRQVSSKDLRSRLRSAAEQWLVNLGPLESVRLAVDGEAFATLSIDFESLYQATTRATTRKVYDALLARILKSFQLDVVVALKRAGSSASKKPINPLIRPTATVPTIFVGHSFLPDDVDICDAVTGVLRALGFQVFTGEKPKAERISEKVKELIDSQDIFVGIFTRRDKLSGKREWTTTTWVIEEKTWAMARNKRLVLLRESGVANIGGMHADYEYIDFKRESFGPALVKLLQLFEVEPRGLR